MKSWLIGIIVCSAVMSCVLKFIPENSIKKSVHISFGIIFLLVTAIPLLNMFSDVSNINYFGTFFDDKIEALDDETDEKYVSAVIAEYSESLNNVAKNKILEKNKVECDVDVVVCADIESSLFGEVLNVKCYVTKSVVHENTEEKDSIFSGIPLVRDIVISLQKATDEKTHDYSGVYETLTELFGITQDQCEIYVEGE